MAANQSAPGLNRGLSIKFLLAEKWKPDKIYRRMCDVYREACFTQKMFTNGFATMSLS